MGPGSGLRVPVETQVVELVNGMDQESPILKTPENSDQALVHEASSVLLGLDCRVNGRGCGKLPLLLGGAWFAL